MRRSERFRRASRWEEATRHPFVRELVRGTLPPERFARYLVQDYAFVETLVTAVSYVAAKAPGMDRKRRFIEFLDALTGPENTYFQEAFQELGVPETEWRRPALEPVTEDFGSFLLAAAGLGTYEDGLAALLPVEWVYLAWATDAPQPWPRFRPYREWIRLHAESAFQEFVEWMRDELDALVLTPTREQELEHRFRRAVAYEVRFWQMAWAEGPGGAAR